MVNLEVENLLQQVLIKLDNIIRKMPDEGTEDQQSFDYIDNADLLRILKISARTAQEWRDRGILVHSKIGAKLYYRKSDVEQMLMAHFNKKTIIN